MLHCTTKTREKPPQNQKTHSPVITYKKTAIPVKNCCLRITRRWFADFAWLEPCVDGVIPRKEEDPIFFFHTHS